MFSKLVVFFLAFFSVLAAAAPGGIARQVSQCNTGNASCCNTVQSSSDSLVTELLGLLGLSLAGITGQVGLGCTPITLVGLGQGANCAQQPVCCAANNFNGLINLGCNPISL